MVTAELERTSEILIGKTIYIVNCFFDENASETAEQKLSKLVISRISDNKYSSVYAGITETLS